MMKTAGIALAMGAAVASSPADAATYLFEVTGSTTLSFELSDEDFYSQSEFDVQFRNSQIVAVLFRSDFGGGLQLYSPNFTIGYGNSGPQLFIGGDRPRIRAGTFTLGFFTPRDTLVVTEIAAAIPEPGTWALLILGFGMTGAAMRAGRRQQARLAF